MITESEQAKIVHALDRSATVTGISQNTFANLLASGWTTEIRMPGGKKKDSLCRCVQNSSRPHPASYQIAKA
jgi:hypothetical protein